MQVNVLFEYPCFLTGPNLYASLSHHLRVHIGERRLHVSDVLRRQKRTIMSTWQGIENFFIQRTVYSLIPIGSDDENDDNCANQKDPSQCSTDDGADDLTR